MSSSRPTGFGFFAGTAATATSAAIETAARLDQRIEHLPQRRVRVREPDQRADDEHAVGEALEPPAGRVAAREDEPERVEELVAPAADRGARAQPRPPDTHERDR